MVIFITCFIYVFLQFAQPDFLLSARGLRKKIKYYLQKSQFFFKSYFLLHRTFLPDNYLNSLPLI